MNKKLVDDEIFEKIKEFKSEVKLSSINIYFKQIKKIIKDLNFTKLKDFFQTDLIIDYLNDNYKNLVKRNYLNSIIVFMKSYNFKEKYIEKFQEIRDEYNNEYTEAMKEGTKSENEEKNWITMKEINEFLENEKKQISNTKDAIKYLNYMILKLQTTYAMRNELHSLKMISESDYKDINDEEKENYLVFKKMGSFISLTDYKTNKTYGTRTFQLKPEDNNMVRIWKNKYHNKDNEYFIYNISNNKPFTTNTYSKYLISLFKINFDRNIGSRLVRKILMSEMFLESKLKMQEQSNILGNSSQTISNIYVKS